MLHASTGKSTTLNLILGALQGANEYMMIHKSGKRVEGSTGATTTSNLAPLRPFKTRLPFDNLLKSGGILIDVAGVDAKKALELAAVIHM
jgi:hypothetical protein